MIRRFATYEEAGIYAGWMRSEGHFSAILDEHMGFIYGPLAISGFRVLVTDEPVDTDEPPPPNAPLLDNILDAMRVVAVAFTLLGLISLLIFAIQFPGRHAIDLISWALRLALLTGLFACLAPLMIAMTRALRDECSLFGRCLRPW